MKIAGDYGQSRNPSKPFVAAKKLNPQEYPVPDEQLIIFVKAPRPGFVKTRLAATVGAETALDTYQTLVEVIRSNLETISDVDLHFTPDDASDEIAPWLCENWTLSPQAEGDLGNKLKHAFHRAFAQGAKRVAIIGSDCPYVAADDIRGAFSELSHHDLVIGPAHDGGYWLIALNAPAPGLFEEINWSTETVLQETLKKAKNEGLSISQLRKLSDVDDVADLMRFHEWNSQRPHLYNR